MMIRSVLPLAAALLLAAALPAQVNVNEIEKQIPPLKLETKVDDKGLKQWAEFPHQNCPACKAKKVVKCMHCDHLEKPEKCPECNTTRKAPCWLCAGEGKLADPLKWAPCPGCRGHGVFLCYFCGNKGTVKFSARAKRGQKCSTCKGNAGVPCTVCKGKRLVPSAFKGKVGQQSLKKLQKSRKSLSQLIRLVESFRAKGHARDDRKAFAALFKKAKPDLPALKKHAAFADDLIKRLNHPNIKDNEKGIVRAYDRIKHNLLYHLVHQSKVLDLCIERAEFNAKLGSAPK